MNDLEKATVLLVKMLAAIAEDDRTSVRRWYNELLESVVTCVLNGSADTLAVAKLTKEASMLVH